MTVSIALEITKSSVLLAEAEKRGGSVRVIRCGRRDLPGNAGPKEIAEAVRAALPDARRSKSELVLVVGDDDTQLRRLELPPVPAEELPGMIRLLAAKELNAADDDPVDYLTVRSEEAGSSVIAARVDQSAMATAYGLAKELDTSLAGVVLRPCTSAALVKRLAPENAVGPRLVVIPSTRGADLVALRDGEPVLIRSTRGGTPEALSADIRRTLPAAGQELGGPPESITVLGSPAETSTQSTPGGELAMRVVDLATAPETEAALGGRMVAEWGPLTGVLGAALQAADGQPAAIDFANPRQAESTAPDRRRQTLLAVAAAAAVLFGLATAYGRLLAIDGEIANLNADIKRLEQETEAFAPYQQQVERIERWLATDVTWLDEYEAIGRRLRPKTLDAKDYPAGDDAYLTSVLLRPPASRGAGGQIDLRAAARTKSVPGQIEQRLRDDRHAVQPVLVSDRASGDDYPVEFQTLIRVERRSTKVAGTSTNGAEAAEPPAEEAAQ